MVFVSIIGDGQSAEVWQCRSRTTGLFLACKQIPKPDTPSAMAAISSEVQCLERAQGCRNVISLHGVYEDTQSVFVLQELCRGGTLHERVKGCGGLREGEARGVFSQIAAALQHCHGRGIVHRDINLANVMVLERRNERIPEQQANQEVPAGAFLFRGRSPPNLPRQHSPQLHMPRQQASPRHRWPRQRSVENESQVASMGEGSHEVAVKLIDFGDARRIQEGESLQGNPRESLRGEGAMSPYTAPEIAAQLPYSFPADIWSLGVLLYGMIANHSPPLVDENQRLDESTGWADACWRHVSPAAKDLIRRMLATSVQDRPTAHEILSDPWVTQSGSDDYVSHSCASCCIAGEKPSPPHLSLGGGIRRIWEAASPMRLTKAADAAARKLAGRQLQQHEHQQQGDQHRPALEGSRGVLLWRSGSGSRLRSEGGRGEGEGVASCGSHRRSKSRGEETSSSSNSGEAPSCVNIWRTVQA